MNVEKLKVPATDGYLLDDHPGVGKYRVALGVLKGDQAWMEQLLEGLPATASQKRAKLATA